MAQESSDDIMQMAKYYAKAEKELMVQPWVYISIERIKLNGIRERIFSYDLPRKLYERKKWVIRWRAAKIQCQYPKEQINCFYSYYDKRLGNDPKLTADLRTLIAAKAQVTRQQRIIGEYIEQHRSDLFFDEDTDKELIMARAKLAKKEANVKAAEERLTTKIKQITEYEQTKGKRNS